jgi:hypothetical protein
MDGGVMDGWWRDVGDDGDEDLLQIPVPAGCQNGVSGSESRFLMAAARGDDACNQWSKWLACWKPQEQGVMNIAASFSLSKKPR